MFDVWRDGWELRGWGLRGWRPSTSTKYVSGLLDSHTPSRWCGKNDSGFGCGKKREGRCGGFVSAQRARAFLCFGKMALLADTLVIGGVTQTV